MCTKRKIAMTWWNKLDLICKLNMMSNDKDNTYSDKYPNDLTRKEIQKIYEYSSNSKKGIT